MKFYFFSIFDNQRARFLTTKEFVPWIGCFGLFTYKLNRSLELAYNALFYIIFQ